MGISRLVLLAGAFFVAGSCAGVAAEAIVDEPLVETAVPSAEAGIEVVMNQARIVKLPRPADTIVIGNSEIADASVQDATTVILTGKGFGVTNLVILDADGAPIMDEQVTVARQSASTVRIYRRSDVQTMSCTPYCESSHKNSAEQRSEDDLRRQ